MLDGREALAPIAGREVGGEAIEHLLRRREVPRRLEHEEAIGCGVEDMELAVDAHVVDTRVRPRVREEDETFLEPHRQAIGHGRRV